IDAVEQLLISAIISAIQEGEAHMDFISKIINDLLYVHPFHTLIVHFPIALTASALFFILLALWRRSDAIEQVAFANISLAAVSTLAAGITGMIDNIRFYDGAAPNVGVKITLAIILLLVTTAMAIARWRNVELFHAPGSKKALYISGYVLSFVLAGVLGFLGGVIVYGF
ncbi:MAG: DUF2231 domain-containing protein, partial [Anaerolineales bacterium]